MERKSVTLLISLLTVGGLASSVKADHQADQKDVRTSFAAESKMERDHDGTFRSNSKVIKEDKDGTITKEIESSSAGKTLLGNEVAKTSKQVTINPPGLFNEESATSESETTSSPQGDFVNSRVKINSVDESGTARSTTKNVKIETNADGSKQTTTQVKKVTDPKGILNKQIENTQKTTVEP